MKIFMTIILSILFYAVEIGTMLHFVFERLLLSKFNLLLSKSNQGIFDDEYRHFFYRWRVPCYEQQLLSIRAGS